MRANIITLNWKTHLTTYLVCCKISTSNITCKTVPAVILLRMSPQKYWFQQLLAPEKNCYADAISLPYDSQQVTKYQPAQASHTQLTHRNRQSTVMPWYCATKANAASLGLGYLISRNWISFALKPSLFATTFHCQSVTETQTKCTLIKKIIQWSLFMMSRGYIVNRQQLTSPIYDWLNESL